ncbi:MAG: cupredoxin domain-containing protein [Gammaproteobacteria bacterium]|nr:cupredoxin domain-containing protein [Gammaproteobacteria bacterium]
MSNSLAVINIIGPALILAIIWWFWIARGKTRKVENNVVEIVVADGVYTPSRIEIPLNQLVVLNFTRKDPSPCAEKVIFSTLEKSHDLPLNETVPVYISLSEPGEHEFTCQMQMYRGSLIAR